MTKNCHSKDVLWHGLAAVDRPGLLWHSAASRRGSCPDHPPHRAGLGLAPPVELVAALGRSALLQHWGKLPENWEFSHCKRQEVRRALHRIPERKPAA